MKRRVVVTGLGFITCIGNDASSVEESVRSLRSGLSRVTFWGNENLALKLIGRPPEFEMEDPSWRRWKIPSRFPIEQSLKRSLPPQGIYSVCAVEQALGDATLEKEALQDGRSGLYCASVGSPLLMYENLSTLKAANGERGNPLGVLSSIVGTLNFNLGSWLGIQGTNCGFVSACASSGHAMGYAFDDIVLGRQDRAVVIGAEEPNAETMLPFMAMRALSSSDQPAGASRPFDKNRDGFVGAGGAVALILEAEEVAVQRGAKIYAELSGWGQASDGYHRASPHPDGRGVARAMELALSSAGVEAADLSYVSAHATSTPAGDVAESKAIRSVLGDASGRVPVSSIKGITGHSLSMAGALEAAVCCLSVQQGFVPGNAHLEEVDPECADLTLPRETVSGPVNSILNNSSGFGGSNVCNVFTCYASKPL